MPIAIDAPYVSLWREHCSFFWKSELLIATFCGNCLLIQQHYKRTVGFLSKDQPLFFKGSGDLRFLLQKHKVVRDGL